jgi:mycothiol S-conjugate amidase
MVEKQRCLLTIHAHPDDESSKGAGTMARYADEGTRVILVCATGGEEGDIINPRMDRPGIKERMTELRKAELETACDILGVARIYMLGYRDSGMPDTEANRRPDAFANIDANDALCKLIEVIRAERPEVIVGYDESPGYPHPDHLRVHELGTRAYHEAGDPDRFPEAGAPWTPSKLYYFAPFSRRRLEALNEAAVASEIESPFTEEFLKEWEERGFKEPDITTQVDVADYVELRTKALLAHATQIDPDSFWFAIPDDVVKKAYPWEDYTLVHSRVETTSPEDDLFAGL